LYAFGNGIHVPGDGAGHQEEVSASRRGHEVNAEALTVVHRAGEPDLQDLREERHVSAE